MLIRYVTYLLTLALIMPHSASSAEVSDDLPPATISSKQIIEYINHERKYIHKDVKINVIRPFLSQSHVLASRYGNTRKVLNLKGLVFEDADFSNTNFRFANFEDTIFRNVDFTGADLTHADFSLAKLENVNLSHANLSKATFIQTRLKKINFSRTNLFKATFLEIAGVSESMQTMLQNRVKRYIGEENTRDAHNSYEYF